MPNPTTYVPPEWAFEMDKEMNGAAAKDLAYWKAAAAGDPGLCESCEIEDAWRYGGCGMCFTCTTGEADPSNDYELAEGAPWPKKK